MGRHLQAYELEKFKLIENKSFQWAGNWKHAHDAFNESYHFEALHPEFTEITEGYDVPIELVGMHSRMINFNMTMSELLPNRADFTPLQRKLFGIDGSGILSVGGEAWPFSGEPRDVHLEIVRRKRGMQDNTHLPYRNLNDEQLVHQCHYTFFPGTTFTSTPEASFLFRYRPHATDPGLCYYDFLITVHNPPGTPIPEVRHRLSRHDEPVDYTDAFAATFDPALAKVLTQDGSNMKTMQRGMSSAGFKGMILGEQEVRVRHFHQMIDRCLMGDYPWQTSARP